MPNLNQCNFIGHMTRDPELKYLPSNTPVAEFGIAVNNHYKTASGEKKEDVMFLDCAIFGARAEALNKYASKGDPIYISGSLRLEQWADKQTGDKRSKHKLNVQDFQFLKGRDAGEQHQSAGRGGERRQPASAGAGRQEPQDTGGGYGDGMDQSDIPFAPDRPRDL